MDPTPDVPDWLATAISHVLDDEQTRKNHGLVNFGRLCQLWDEPKRPKDRCLPSLHRTFLQLMERYDLSYRITEPHIGESDERCLIAELGPDFRPER